MHEVNGVEFTSFSTINHKANNLAHLYRNIQVILMLQDCYVAVELCWDLRQVANTLDGVVLYELVLSLALLVLALVLHPVATDSILERSLYHAWILIYRIFLLNWLRTCGTWIAMKINALPLLIISASIPKLALHRRFWVARCNRSGWVRMVEITCTIFPTKTIRAMFARPASAIEGRWGHYVSLRTASHRIDIIRMDVAAAHSCLEFIASHAIFALSTSLHSISIYNLEKHSQSKNLYTSVLFLPLLSATRDMLLQYVTNKVRQLTFFLNNLYISALFQQILSTIHLGKPTDDKILQPLNLLFWFRFDP